MMTRRPYSYIRDDIFNRHLGEPIDYDWAGAVRKKTWRWRWQRFCYQLGLL